MKLSEARQILKENGYVLNEETEITEQEKLVYYAKTEAQHLGLDVEKNRDGFEFNYRPENGNSVINAGYTKNGKVYLRKHNRDNDIYYVVNSREDIIKGFRDFIDVFASKEYI